ncbi:MAG: phage terminase large subunit family protein [Lentisphaeria bacterium]|nr:phage terminase large subunit family protein [Lentisphaeria bacterium]
MSAAEKIYAGMSGFLHLPVREDIVDWASKNIDLSGDISSQGSRIDFARSPFLIEPLRAWNFDGIKKEVVVAAPEQMGKTLLEVVGVIYNITFTPCQIMVVYPSDEAAKEINITRYEPLIRKIPFLAPELERPYCARQDRYRFSSTTMFFQGAGKKIMSKACKIVVNDEAAAWGKISGISNIEDSKKRTRSFDESIYYSVSTPSMESDEFWQCFLAGSQAYWTLRCQGCGKLTIRSCDLHLLQFESAHDEEADLWHIVPGSCRLPCPKCGYEHVEAEKYKMIAEAEYVPKFPERHERTPSFQFGVLTNQTPAFAWDIIAQKILESGRRADLMQQKTFDNSWRGLPYRPRKVGRDDIENIKEHFIDTAQIDDEDIQFVFMVSDTQDTFSPTGVFGYDVNDNIVLLEYHNVEHLSLLEDERRRVNDLRKSDGLGPIVTLEDMLERKYKGLTPMVHIIDCRGHRTQEIKQYSRTHRKVFMYAGAALRNEEWKKSQNEKKMFLVSAKYYQVLLIWYLYSQKSKEGNYFFLTNDLSDATMGEITAVQPDKTKRNGHSPENWEPLNDAVHDAFDVLKMALFAVDFAFKLVGREHFARIISPKLKQRFRMT